MPRLQITTIPPSMRGTQQVRENLREMALRVCVQWLQVPSVQETDEIITYLDYFINEYSAVNRKSSCLFTD